MKNSDGDFVIENGDGYSLATGPETDKKPKKARYFSKERRDARKAERKAKHGARPLKSVVQGGVKKFKDILHPVTKNADGSGTKADGTIVPAQRMGTIAAPKGLNVAPLNFDKMDVAGKAAEAIIEAGEPKVAVVIPANETTTVAGEVFKTSDTVAATGEVADKKEGMSTTTKIIIGVGAGLLVLGVVVYLVKRKNNKK